MSSPWIVLKFGGSSVAVASHWQTIANQIQLQLAHGKNIILVLSALKNVSNLLEALLHQARAGVHQTAVDHLLDMHINFAAELGLDLNTSLEALAQALSDDCRLLFDEGRISPKSHARILAYGELFSTTIGSAYLQTYLDSESADNDSKPAKLNWLDARTVLQSLSCEDELTHYTAAECQWHIANQTLAELMQSSNVIVSQGFIAADEHGDTVLLGREGSDTSAAYFAALCAADSIEIWTDVPGVFSFNPHRYAGALQLNRLNFEQARRLAEFGAKVLHPRCIKPAADNNIPILIRSTHQPALTGTLISEETYSASAIHALAEEDNLLWLKIDSLTDQQLGAIQLSLNQLGYQMLLCEQSAQDQQKSAQHHLIFQYRNSDQMAPTNKSLQLLLASHLDKDTFVLSQHSAALTVCGEAVNPATDKDNWLAPTASLVEQTIGCDSQILRAPQRGRMTILISEPDAAERQRLCLDLASQIHSRMIIPQLKNSPYKTWDQLYPINH